MPTPPPAGKSARTRRDLVQAAIESWSVDNTRSLGEVAHAAGVGRTTLNRYFPSRAALVAAVDEECRIRFDAAIRGARPDADDGLAAVVRMCAEVLQLGPVLGLIFADSALVDPDSWGAGSGPEVMTAGLLRGQRDGSVASDLPAEWIATHTWTTLFGAWLVIRSEDATTAEVTQLLARTLTGGISR
ncbi:TetR/AcrR family transcriptional regulator [uncultured Friedmanniella sp.]|uniref:TetR/AcrR family transcriptional regulator n=1 Tax=uncultured Friedmanniella sp. TaxID=335381 RepID=UPI0035CC159D